MNDLRLFKLYNIFFIIYMICNLEVHASGYIDDTVTCGKLDFQCADNDRCLPRTLFCNDKYDCDNKFDEDYCNSYNTSSCPPKWWKCSNKYRCIPEHWRCNGFKDCQDNTDEVGCESISVISPRMEDISSKRNLIKWFLKRRKNGSTTNKWGHELSRTAIALFLGDNSFFIPGNRTMEEMSYELSIQLLSDLSRVRFKLLDNLLPVLLLSILRSEMSKAYMDRKVNRKDLATYIHALMVTCIDPRNFHGRDLVSELRKKVESSGNNTNPFEILTLCNAGDKMSEKDVDRIAFAYNNRSRPFWIDNQAMATIALACLINTTDVVLDERTLTDMEQELKKRQFRNGTVENLKTTALVVQALIATQSYKRDFDLEAAIKIILQIQKSDGSIGSFLESYYILPALSNSSLMDITSEHCKRSTTSEEEALIDFQRTRGEKISTQFSVWIGSAMDLKRSWILKVPLNSTFYDILEIANKLDTRQRITYNVIDGKPYVSAITELQDDIERGLYWFIYVRAQNSEEDPKLVEDSPVDVKIVPNQELILWYKSS